MSAKANSQAYLPPGAKGLVLPAPPAPPSVQIAVGGQGDVYVIDQRTGAVFSLVAGPKGTFSPQRVATVAPAEVSGEMPEPIPAYQVEGVEPPRPIEPRYRYR
jgi:hypothetical protein